MLLPFRDAEPWLAETLLDLRGQTLRAIEFLAVDDGSGDGGPAMVAEQARRDARFRLLEGGGRGPAAALNLGLAEARAPLVGHMEADDRCPPDRFEALAAALEEAPSLDAITSGAEIFGARTAGMQRYVDWQNELRSAQQMAAARFVEIPALHQTGLYRRRALERLEGWREPPDWPLDIDFWMRFYAAGLQAAKLDRVLYRWRQHPRQSTRTSPRHRLENLQRCKARFFAQGPARGQVVELCSTGLTLERWASALRAEGVQLRTRDYRAGEPIESSEALRLFVFGAASVRRRIAASPAFRADQDWFAA